MKKAIVITMVLVATVVVCSGPAIGNADSANFTTDSDNYVRSDDPTRNYGDTTYLGMWDRPSSDGNILYHFDLSTTSMPTIQNATLNVRLRSTVLDSGETFTVNVYRIVEGNSWSEGQSCWNLRSTGNQWAGGQTGCGTSGTDYYATLAGTINFTSTSTTNHTYGIDITASVIQAWADNSSDNAGFVLVGTSSSPNDSFSYVELGSRDHPTSSQWATLDVTYTPEPATMLLLGIGGLGVLVRRRRRG